MKTSQNDPAGSRTKRFLTRLACAGALLLMGAVAQARSSYVFTNEDLYPTQFPSADGWTINSTNRVGYIEVTQYGLDAQVAGGSFINGGTRALRIKGSAALPLNNWLTYVAGAPMASSGPLYFGFSMEAESLGITTDPHELFLRVDASWGIYVAVKMFAGVLELPGPVTFPIPSPAAGQTYRVVGRIDIDGSGNMTGLKAWIDPAYGDEASPDASIALPGTTHISTIDRFDLRSQKAVSIVDDIKFASTWDAVVPPMPADPGNLVVTLPADTNAGAPGIQVTGGTLFVKVGGVDYVAATPLAPGTQVTFQMIPDYAGGAYLLTGWQGYKGPRTSWQPFHDFLDATVLGTPSTVQVDLVIPIYAPLNIRPIFEFGDYRMVYVPNGGTLYRTRTGTSTTNRMRTLFDAGESVNFRALGLANYEFGSWISPAAVSATDTTPSLTVGAGVLSGAVTNIEARRNFGVLTYMTLGTTNVIGPNANGIEFEANNLGAAGSVPLNVMRAIVTEKAAQGLAAVVNFESVVDDSRALLYDPSPANDTPVPAAIVINRDPITNAYLTSSVIKPTRKIRMAVGATTIEVETGDYWYTEAAGAVNLATSAGPGPASTILDNNYFYNGNRVGPFQLTGLPSNRVPTSGDVSLGNTTSYEWVFKSTDKVVMAGAVYLSRNDFQHSNPNDIPKLWAKATYSDGTTSDTLYSTKLEQNTGLADHFFGFESPAGKYITSLHIWCRGGNNRAFTTADDLVVVLEGTNNYVVTGVSNNNAYGTVSGSASAADGGTVTLTATPVGAPFMGWAYALAPGAIISTSPTLVANVHGTVTIKGIFDPHPAGFGGAVAPAGANLQIDWFGYPEFDYTLQSSTNMVKWTVEGTVIPGAGANESRALPFNPPNPLFLRLEYQSK